MWKAWGTTYVLGATLSSVSTTRFGIFIRLIPNWGIRWWLSTLKKHSLETEEGLSCVLWYWPHSDIAVDGSHNARMSKARCILSEEKHSDGDSKKKKSTEHWRAEPGFEFSPLTKRDDSPATEPVWVLASSASKRITIMLMDENIVKTGAYLKCLM